MKILRFNVFVIFLHFTATAQIDNLAFDNFTPRWFFVDRDTNFTDTSEFINTYKSISPSFVPLIEEDYNYCSFLTEDKNIDITGGGLFKFRNQDGKIIWGNIYNPSNGDSQNSFTSISRGKYICFAGRKRTKWSYENDNYWMNSGNSTAFYREIDPLTGHILSEIYDKKDTVGEKNKYFSESIFTFNQKYRKFIVTDSGYHFLHLQTNNILPEKVQFLPFTDRLPKEDLFRSKKTFFLTDDKTLHVLRYEIHKDSTQGINKGKIEKYQPDNNDSLILKTTIDFGKYFKRLPISSSNDFYYYHFNKNKAFTFAKTYQVGTNFDVRSWFLWLDSLGNEILYLPEIKLTANSHLYRVVFPFYSDDYYSYCWTNNSHTQNKGVDIIRISKQGEVSIVGEITTGDETKIQVTHFTMNQKGDMVFYFGWEGKYSGVMGLHISDFGISLDANDPVSENTQPLLTISPNPGLDIIRLNMTDHENHAGVVNIFNIKGEIVKSQKWTAGESIDINMLYPGNYFVCFSPQNRKGYYLISAFSKI